jgi:hypothetical protein
MDCKINPAARSFKEQIHHISSAITLISQSYWIGREAAFSVDIKISTNAQLADYVAKFYN